MRRCEAHDLKLEKTNCTNDKRKCQLIFSVSLIAALYHDEDALITLLLASLHRLSATSLDAKGVC